MTHQKLFESLVKSYVKLKRSGKCLPVSIMLWELFQCLDVEKRHNIKLVVGYVNNMTKKYSVAHVWVTHDDIVYDVGLAVCRQLFSKSKDDVAVLSEEPIFPQMHRRLKYHETRERLKNLTFKKDVSIAIATANVFWESWCHNQSDGVIDKGIRDQLLSQENLNQEKLNEEKLNEEKIAYNARQCEPAQQARQSGNKSKGVLQSFFRIAAPVAQPVNDANRNIHATTPFS